MTRSSFRARAPIVAAALALLASQAHADSFKSTNYDEKYRGQYHFSQQSGWINDVNGVWYYNGTWYLTYQTTPGSPVFDFGATSWGMATSPDLLHWTQHPPIAQPTSAEGTPMSGSAVIDVDNTSGLRTGSNPVFVAMYTASNLGQSLMYSNDLGATWTRYAHNPVIPGPGGYPRDPHVFWHAPTNRWVMIEYGPTGDPGASIWTSPNLIDWTEASVVANFDQECPDLFPLTYGGVQKWVVWSADSSYLIGSFDGRTFTPDPGGPYHLYRQLPSQPDWFYYASQTFNIASLPQPRVIQMGWEGRWNHTVHPEESVAGSPWSQNHSFPTELSLVSTSEGVRLASNPIAEVSQLWTSTSTWPAQNLAAGQDPLKDLRAKAFDLTVAFDITGATATQLVLNIANRKLVYDVAAQTLDGVPLPAIGGKVSLRVLADWSQFELFGNGGQFYTVERFGFQPWNATLGLGAVGGKLSLAGITFHAMARTWPGQANAGSSVDETLYTRYEAESGTLGGGAAAMPYVAASGGYNLGVLDNVGAYGQVTVNVPAAGTYELVQRYANGLATASTKSLYVNGARVGAFSYAPTGGWTSYADVRGSVTLAAGNNTIRVQRDASDTPSTDFDYFLVSRGRKVEWESGTASGGASFNAYAQASGGLQLGNLDAVGARGQVSVTVAAAGAYDLGLVYANGMGDTRHKSLYVNGAKQTQMSLPATGGWTSYATAHASVKLAAGTNQIAIQRDAKDDAATDFDYLTLAPYARLEAESGSIGGGATVVGHGTSSNNAQVGNMNNVGAYFEVDAKVAAAGARALVLRYANGQGYPCTKTIYVNGALVGQVQLPPTGGWTRMADASFTVTLKAGTNKIRVENDANDVSTTDFDYILVP